MRPDLLVEGGPLHTIFSTIGLLHHDIKPMITSHRLQLFVLEHQIIFC